MKTLKRTKFLTVRLSDAEYELLKSYSEEVGAPARELVRDFIRSLRRRKRIERTDTAR